MCSSASTRTFRSRACNWFFDHAETISEQSIDRIAALGGGIAVQHRMAYQGEYFVERYGPGAAEATPPVARIMEKGVKVSAGTDATRVASYNPWVSLAWLVTGRTVGGLRLYPQRNCLDRETALRMWTENVTWFSNEEGKKGRIQVGQLADLIVPDRDYFSCAEDEIADTISDLTIVGGKSSMAPAISEPRRRPPPPAMPDWSPVRAFGGYAAWGDPSGAGARHAEVARQLRLRATPAPSTATTTPRLVRQRADPRSQELLGRARLLLLRVLTCAMPPAARRSRPGALRRRLKRPMELGTQEPAGAPQKPTRPATHRSPRWCAAWSSPAPRAPSRPQCRTSSAFALAFPGIGHPRGTPRREFPALHRRDRFVDRAARSDFKESPEYREWMRRLRELTEGEPSYRGARRARRMVHAARRPRASPPHG